MINEVPDGVMTWWHINGQKKVESNVINGQPHGLATQWYDDGQKKCERNFVNGRGEGTGIEWDENGQELEPESRSYTCPETGGLFSMRLVPGQKVVSKRILPEETITAVTDFEQITTTVIGKTSASDLKRMHAMTQDSLYCGD